LTLPFRNQPDVALSLIFIIKQAYLL